MNKQYFIDKFTAIPDEQWTTGFFTDKEGRHCALGHCGAPSGYEWRALSELVGRATQSCISNINDGKDPNFQQLTPKARILAALNSIP